MIQPTFEQFINNKEKYGRCASWAIWKIGASEQQRFAPKPTPNSRHFLNSFVLDLNKIENAIQFNQFAKLIHTEIVLVALNFAKRDDTPDDEIEDFVFGAFHEETSTTSDHRLRDACLGTPLWGGYITDLVKFKDGKISPVRDSNSNNISKLLRNQDFLNEQIDGLCTELSELGCKNPTIVALGNAVFDALVNKNDGLPKKKILESLGNNTRLVRITHYSKATGISHHNYVAKVYQELNHQSIIRN
ncbi:hypothetical protein [Rothia nasimurium]|uniref:hypothetical protein n=1 Tax=Rothia nasimurium TaxID=85336 RepID=UPI001F323E33|nr:hypothetical protein [Rothia nasimurium]